MPVSSPGGSDNPIARHPGRGEPIGPLASGLYGWRQLIPVRLVFGVRRGIAPDSRAEA
jgi:hypothetical protein